MKVYQASTDLVEILIRNGFVEITERLYPDHLKSLQSVKFYNPGSVKRHFKRERLEFLIDYINIGILKGSSYIFQNISITEHQLKSVVIFLNLNDLDRQYLKTKNVLPFSLYEYLTSDPIMIETKPKFYKQLVESFNTLSL